MATSTERFGFTLPSGQDPASVVPLNLNTQNIEKYLGMTQDMLAPLYDATEGTYEVDDIVTHDSVLYKCITAVETPEDFDETKWVQTTAVSEGGGGAGAIEKTQAEYNELTPAQKTNGAIYMVQDDGTGDYEYHTNQAETIVVRVNKTTNEIEWFFVDYTFAGGSVEQIPSELMAYLPASTISGNAYDTSLQTMMGYVAINAQGGFGLYPTDYSREISGTVKCLLKNTDGTEQANTYIDPYEGTGDAVNKIYFMGTEYANTNGGSGGGTSEGEGVEIYSESEYIVGKWVDGKKLYQKTIDFGAMPSQGNSKSIAHNISDIDKVISWEAFGVNASGMIIFVPNVSRGNVLAQTSMSADRTNVTIYNGNSSDLTDAFNGYVTIRYTKTVETPAPAWGGSVTNNYANFIDTSNVIQAETQVSSGTTGTYTATEDCYIRVKLWRSSTGASSLSIDGVEVLTNYSDSGTSALYNTTPLKKGQTATIDAGAGSPCSYTVYGITYASGGSSSGSSVEYSTDEHKVGTWIDGRDVYEKTIYCASKQGRDSVVIANYPTSNDIDYFALQNISYIVNNTYYEGLSIVMEVACGTSGVALDNNNAPSGFPTDFTNIYTTIRYVKKAVS